MNSRTGKRLMVALKMLGVIVGLMTAFGLMIKFAPWMVFVIFVGWMGYMIWDMTDNMVD
jgi:hypothetical protein